jgi:thiol-disulfide isomerase/thioredoxin
MKAIILSLLVITSYSSNAQSQFEVIGSGQDKTLKGLVNRKDIISDTSFTWFSANQAGYKANSLTVDAMKNHGDSIQILAFGGTWCHDTQFILPRFFTIVDAAKFPEKNITIIGVDEQKHSLGNLSEAMAVINVPTFIVMKNGKEIGRVVEYGKTGQWDKEIGEVINAAN